MTAFAEELARRSAAFSDIHEHLGYLGELAERSKIILELGVRGGISTSAFLAGVEKSVGHLWSVDIEEPHVPAWWRDSALWTLTIGDDLDPEIAAAQPQEADLLFVDTSHFYEHTIAELRLYVPRVKRGGVVCCHDTELGPVPGIPEYIPFSVARALTDYCKEAGLLWTNRPGSYGLGVIQVPLFVRE